MVLLHGLGEHSGRYEGFADRLAAAGIDVHAYDERGFGASDGRRAWVARWSELHDDLERVVAEVRTADPLVLYGHSLGGLVATGYVVDGRPSPDLLVLSAPGIDDELARWKHLASRLLDRIAPGLRVANGIRRADLEDDPLVQETTTAHLGRAAFAEQARLQAVLDRLDRMPVPTLVYRGADDPIVPARTLDRFARLADVTTRTYPGLRHETHNARTGERVADDVIAWIREQAAGLAPAARSALEATVPVAPPGVSV